MQHVHRLHIFWSVSVVTELQRGRGRWDEKKKLGIGNLRLVFPSHVWFRDLSPYCLLQTERAGRWGRGEAYSARGGGGFADRGDEPREALWKCHCHFDSWTVFKKGRCWPFPPLCWDKGPGRQRGEPGLGFAPRGMFRLNKQLWTMSTFCPPWHSPIPPHTLYKVWKLSRTQSWGELLKFTLLVQSSVNFWLQVKRKKLQSFESFCEFEFLMSWKEKKKSSLHVDKRKVKFNLTLIQMAWEASGSTETIWFCCSGNSNVTVGKFEQRWLKNLLKENQRNQI